LPSSGESRGIYIVPEDAKEPNISGGFRGSLPLQENPTNLTIFRRTQRIYPCFESSEGFYRVQRGPLQRILPCSRGPEDPAMFRRI
jgi:hypothetical protein